MICNSDLYCIVNKQLLYFSVDDGYNIYNKNYIINIIDC